MRLCEAVIVKKTKLLDKPFSILLKNKNVNFMVALEEKSGEYQSHYASSSEDNVHTEFY